MWDETHIRTLELLKFSMTPPPTVSNMDQHIRRLEVGRVCLVLLLCLMIPFLQMSWSPMLQRPFYGVSDAPPLGMHKLLIDPRSCELEKPWPHAELHFTARPV
jgi:hypothetical protein